MEMIKYLNSNNYTYITIVSLKIGNNVTNGSHHIFVNLVIFATDITDILIANHKMDLARYNIF